MKPLNPVETGLALGAVLALYHLTWSALVAFGLAQPAIDFILRAHFIRPIYMIDPFNLGWAVTLLILVFALGFALAFVFALLWNRLQRTGEARSVPARAGKPA